MSRAASIVGGHGQQTVLEGCSCGRRWCGEVEERHVTGGNGGGSARCLGGSASEAVAPVA
jgi:hypothetical protein